MIQKQKGFTLIELMIVIAIIGILATVVMASLSNSKDRAKVASVQKMMQSTVSAMNVCMTQKLQTFCYGTPGVSTTSSDCGGGASADPRSGTQICGLNSGSSTTDSVWPDVSLHGYRYSAYVGSDTTQGLFSFSVYKDFNDDDEPDEAVVLCCTQDGCGEIADAIASGVGTADGMGDSCRAMVTGGSYTED